MKSLVRRAKKGDDQAFVELIEENKQAMYKVAVGILKNDSDAADAIQESILTCYEKLAELKKPQYFKTWMMRILYYIEEMSIREIGQILQMNENRVKTRLSRGRGAYKKLYLKEHPEFQYE